MKFGAFIIGDEIISGKRHDAHFKKLTSLMSARGLRLSWVCYLGDQKEQIVRALTQSFESGNTVFCFGGIGNTPDDQTRAAVADALGVDLILHPIAEREIRARFGADANEKRLSLGCFPRGVSIIPNPFNRIPGFYIRDHYFVPGFPQMAHPMVEWALDQFYSHLFNQKPMIDKAFLLTGENAYESALLDLMERIVAEYPDLRLYSLPSIKADGERTYLELGVEGTEPSVDKAMEEIRRDVEARGIQWAWRE